MAVEVKEYELQGCFAPAGSEAMGSLLGNDYTTAEASEMCLSMCVSLCTSTTSPLNASYPYVGVTNGQYCYCGTQLAPAAILATSDNCAIPCIGNTSETCGGTAHMSIYKLTTADNNTAVTKTANGDTSSKSNKDSGSGSGSGSGSDSDSSSSRYGGTMSPGTAVGVAVGSVSAFALLLFLLIFGMKWYGRKNRRVMEEGDRYSSTTRIVSSYAGTPMTTALNTPRMTMSMSDNPPHLPPTVPISPTSTLFTRARASFQFGRSGSVQHDGNGNGNENGNGNGNRNGNERRSSLVIPFGRPSMQEARPSISSTIPYGRPSMNPSMNPSMSERVASIHEAKIVDLRRLSAVVVDRQISPNWIHTPDDDDDNDDDEDNGDGVSAVGDDTRRRRHASLASVSSLHDDEDDIDSIRAVEVAAATTGSDWWGGQQPSPLTPRVPSSRHHWDRQDEDDAHDGEGSGSGSGSSSGGGGGGGGGVGGSGDIEPRTLSVWTRQHGRMASASSASSSSADRDLGQQAWHRRRLSVPCTQGMSNEDISAAAAAAAATAAGGGGGGDWGIDQNRGPSHNQRVRSVGGAVSGINGDWEERMTEQLQRQYLEDNGEEEGDDDDDGDEEMVVVLEQLEEDVMGEQLATPRVQQMFYTVSDVEEEEEEEEEPVLSPSWNWTVASLAPDPEFEGSEREDD